MIELPNGEYINPDVIARLTKEEGPSMSLGMSGESTNLVATTTEGHLMQFSFSSQEKRGEAIELILEAQGETKKERLPAKSSGKVEGVCPGEHGGSQ